MNLKNIMPGEKSRLKKKKNHVTDSRDSRSVDQ